MISVIICNALTQIHKRYFTITLNILLFYHVSSFIIRLSLFLSTHITCVVQVFQWWNWCFSNNIALWKKGKGLISLESKDISKVLAPGLAFTKDGSFVVYFWYKNLMYELSKHFSNPYRWTKRQGKMLSFSVKFKMSDV